MKKLIVRIFTELYHWHNNNFGKAQQPALTSLLILSALQIGNALSVLIIIQNITSIDIASFIGDKKEFSVLAGVIFLIIDYLAVRPIDVTIEQNPRRKRTIAWIYVLGTLLVLALCVVWIIYINEHK